MDQGSAAERCASCGAGLAPDAPWCSLCFAPVPVAAPVVARHEPEPPVRVAPAAAAPAVRVAAAHPLYPEITPERLGRHSRPADPAADEQFRLRPGGSAVPQPRVLDPLLDGPAPAPVVAEGGVDVEDDAPSWPCLRCGGAVPMAADVCPECGGGFLAGLMGATPTLMLPVVGDLTTKTPAQRYAIAAAIGLSAAVLVVGLIALVGAVL